MSNSTQNVKYDRGEAQGTDTDQVSRPSFTGTKRPGNPCKPVTKTRSARTGGAKGHALQSVAASSAQHSTGSNTERRTSMNSCRSEKTRAFDSLLRRTNRQQLTTPHRGTSRGEHDCQASAKDGSLCDGGSSVPEETKTEHDKVGDGGATGSGSAAVKTAVRDVEEAMLTKQQDDTVEYTILARPSNKQGENEMVTATESTKMVPADDGRRVTDDKTEANEECDTKVEGTAKGNRGRGRGRPGCMSRIDAPYLDAPPMFGQFSPDFVRPPYEECPCIPTPPWTCSQPPPFFPGPYGPPAMFPGPVDQYCIPKFQCYDPHLPPPYMDGSCYSPLPPFPPTPPVGIPPFPPMTPPMSSYPSQGSWYDKGFVNRQRTRCSSYPRRLNYEGSNTRYQDRRSHDYGDGRDYADQGKEDDVPREMRKSNADTKASSAQSFNKVGFKQRSSASWPSSSLPDDDIEDLFPLIDQLAIAYPSSDSSTDSTRDNDQPLPDKDSWFTVLPNSVSASDRFIWSPRRDLHRPKSIWSPINPKLVDTAQDGMRPRNRNRTYTESATRKVPETVMEVRRAISCEQISPSDEVEILPAAESGGWSPWDCRLDPLKDMQKK